MKNLLNKFNINFDIAGKQINNLKTKEKLSKKKKSKIRGKKTELRYNIK